jgi:Acetyltransferase (GNAT) domain
MPTGTDVRRQTWPPTVFETEAWEEAWSRSTIEHIKASEGSGPPLYLVEYSPFWHGYEVDTEMERVWDRPLVTVGTLYSFYGPSYLLDDPDRVPAVVERARERAAEWGAFGALVVNLPEEAANQWAEICPPDARLRLDVAYHRPVEDAADPKFAGIRTHVRTEWRRRWRRATERGVRLVDDREPSTEVVEQVLSLTNGSAVKHGWPPVYDRTTLEQVLQVPGSRILRADWEGRTIGGFVALEHDRRVYLWAGGIDHTVLGEVSPYLFMLYEVLATGAERGWDRVEFGRGNDTFKRRYGFEGTELWSLWYAARPEDVDAYRPKLTALHDGLARCMGL